MILIFDDLKVDGTKINKVGISKDEKGNEYIRVEMNNGWFYLKIKEGIDINILTAELLNVVATKDSADLSSYLEVVNNYLSKTDTIYLARQSEKRVHRRYSEESRIYTLIVYQKAGEIAEEVARYKGKYWQSKNGERKRVYFNELQNSFIDLNDMKLCVKGRILDLDTWYESGNIYLKYYLEVI